MVVLSVQQETGGSLAEVLANLSGIIRKRRQLYLKVRALTSEGRWSYLTYLAVCRSLYFAFFITTHLIIWIPFYHFLGQNLAYHFLCLHSVGDYGLYALWLEWKFDMSLTTLILPAIAAIMVFLTATMVLQYANKKETVSQRMQRMLGGTTRTESLAERAKTIVDPLRIEKQYSPLAIICESILQVLGINTEAFCEKSQLLFYCAGVTSPDAPVYFLFFRFVGGPIFVAAAAYMAFFLPGSIHSLLCGTCFGNPGNFWRKDVS